jgi:hypothetical protein
MAGIILWLCLSAFFLLELADFVPQPEGTDRSSARLLVASQQVLEHSYQALARNPGDLDSHHVVSERVVTMERPDDACDRLETVIGPYPWYCAASYRPIRINSNGWHSDEAQRLMAKSDRLRYIQSDVPRPEVLISMDAENADSGSESDGGAERCGRRSETEHVI